MSCGEFVIDMPDGYDTILGFGDDKAGGRIQLSGGQKQRSMLARAGLRNPPILSNGTKGLFFGGLAAPELVSYLSPGTTEKRHNLLTEPT